MNTPEIFMQYFRANYPGPTTISRPDWHAPKIYRAAISASGLYEALALLVEACHKRDAGDPLFDGAVDAAEKALAKAQEAVRP